VTKEIEETKKQLHCQDDASRKEKTVEFYKMKASDVLMRGAGVEISRPTVTREYPTEVKPFSEKKTPRRQTSLNKQHRTDLVLEVESEGMNVDIGNKTVTSASRFI
jgi:hypothetical protein